jgi:hypothetical protein
MDLINCLSALPANVVGAHVFGFLSLTTLGRLDAALVNKEHRLLVMDAMSFITTTIPLPSLGASNVRCEKAIWRWCVDRTVTLTEVQFSNLEGGEEFTLLENILLRVRQNGVVRYICDSSTDMTESMNFALGTDTVRSRITSLGLHKTGTGRIPMWKWGNVPNVITLAVNGGTVSEVALKQLLLGISALEIVNLHDASLLSSDTVRALCGHGGSLTKILLENTTCQPELLSSIGQHCHNLKELTVMSLTQASASSPWSNEQGWMAVAHGCPKLVNATIWFAGGLASGLTEAAQLAFATHCPELEVYGLGAPGATMTDAVLLALSAGCPKLRSLLCDKWTFESIDTIDAAQPLLSRLENCPLSCLVTSPAIVAQTVSYLRNVKSLSILNVSAQLIDALRGRTISLEKCQTLFLSGARNGRVVVDDLVIAVAAGCPQLRAVDLVLGACITEPALTQLGVLCPNMESVHCVDHVLANVSEDALLTLASSWPKLKQLYIGDNLAYTDAALRAMGQHCTRLECVNLSLNTAVTVEALLEAVDALPYCRFLVPNSFSPVEQSWVKEAVVRVRAEAKGRRRLLRPG